MNLQRTNWTARLGAGLLAGTAIVYLDNYAFEGEVSPMVIVAFLLAATAMAGGIWGKKGWGAAVATWVCIPLAHLVKHVLGLPDTLHPNTYLSILFLAMFTLVIAAIGTSCGLGIHQYAVAASRAD